MADGITQPGGGTTAILIQNDAHADAGGDGSYSFADISTKFPLLCIDLGTTPKSYRMTVSLTNGDGGAGVGTTTTLKDADCFVVFDSTRTYSVSATGRSTRYTEFGVLVDGTKDSAKQGVSIVFGASTTIQGNGKLYGSNFKVTTGNLVLAPGQTGLSYSIINCILYAVTGAVACGVSATANVDTVYNVDITGGSGAVGAINNFGATIAERLTVALNAAGTNHIRTNSTFSAKDVVFIGTGAGTGGQLRLGGAGTILVSPTWDQGLKIQDAANAVGDEYWPYGIVVLDGSRNPISGLSFTLQDGVGATVVSATTDANGMISFGSGVTANCVKVVAYGGGTGYQGPYTARINQAPINANYPQRTVTFGWPSTASWLTGNVQYQDMFDVIQLIPPPGNPTNWNECSL